MSHNFSLCLINCEFDFFTHCMPFVGSFTGVAVIQSLLGVLHEHSHRWRTFTWREETCVLLSGNPFSSLLRHNPAVRFDQLERLDIDNGSLLRGFDWRENFSSRFPKLRVASLSYPFPGLAFLPLTQLTEVSLRLVQVDVLPFYHRLPRSK